MVGRLVCSARPLGLALFGHGDGVLVGFGEGFVSAVLAPWMILGFGWGGCYQQTPAVAVGALLTWPVLSVWPRGCCGDGVDDVSREVPAGSVLERPPLTLLDIDLGCGDGFSLRGWSLSGLILIFWECSLLNAFKTAVVTGASRGFGRAIAGALVAAGTDVVGIARDEQQLDAVRGELGEVSPRRPRTPLTNCWRGTSSADTVRACSFLTQASHRIWRACPSRPGTVSAATGRSTLGTSSHGSGRRSASRWRRAAWSSRYPAQPPWADRPSAVGTPARRPPSGSSADMQLMSRSGLG